MTEISRLREIVRLRTFLVLASLLQYRAARYS